MGQRLTQEEAIKRLKEVHSEYSYEKTVYTSADNKIAVICSVHGEFHTRYADHVRGSKCKLCSNITIREKQAMGLDKFIEQANYVHNNYYTYGNSVYVNNRTKIAITCKTHGDFFQAPEHHLNGHGCKKCTMSTSSWRGSSWQEKAKKSKNFTGFKFYVLKCYSETEEFIKIGKTFKAISKRYDSYKKLPYSYELLLIKEGTSEQVTSLELDAHKKLKEFKYSPATHFGGYKECYSLEALNLLL